jgi:hypothetical protein
VRGIAQRQQRPADGLAGDRLARVGAFLFDPDLALAIDRLRRRCDVGGEIRLQGGVDHMSVAIVDLQVADLRGGRGRCVGLRSECWEQPVRRVAGGLLGLDLGMVHDNGRQDDLAAMEVGHHVDRHGQTVDGGEGFVGREARGVGNGHAVGDGNGLAAGLQVEVPQGDGAAEGGRRLRFDERAEPVPVPEHREQNDAEHEHARDRPADAFAARAGCAVRRRCRSWFERHGPRMRQDDERFPVARLSLARNRQAAPLSMGSYEHYPTNGGLRWQHRSSLTMI